MSLVKSVVLAGAGNLGGFVLEELINSGFDVTVFSRPSSDKQFPPGVKVNKVDYSDESAVADAVKGADAVVSTLTALDSQANLIRAAKKAGVKLFVPGEFGNPSTKLTPEDHPALHGKKKAQDLLKEVQLPAILVFTGPFLDTVFRPYIGFDFQNGTVRLIGKGETPVSLTSRRDTARFLAHHLANLSSLPSPGSPSVLRLEGDRSTFKDAAELYARLHPGTKLSYSYVSLDEADKIAKDVKADFGKSLVTYLLTTWERGATTDEGEELSNGEWPEWKPLKLEEHFRSLSSKL
ncbi:hypothetical protein JCM8097_005725 [Rhodosporidiobolus ruineniae]